MSDGIKWTDSYCINYPYSYTSYNSKEISELSNFLENTIPYIFPDPPYDKYIYDKEKRTISYYVKLIFTKGNSDE